MGVGIGIRLRDCFDKSEPQLAKAGSRIYQQGLRNWLCQAAG